MDIVVKSNSFWQTKVFFATISLVLFLGAVIGVNTLSATHIKYEKLNPLKIKRIVIPTRIPVTGIIESKNSRVIDVIAPGVVESLFVENGQRLNEDQAIVTLSNPTLLLEVNRNQALVAEQNNQHRLNSLRMEQEKYTNKLDLLHKTHQLDVANTKFERVSALLKVNSISQDEFDKILLEKEFLETLLITKKESNDASIKLQEQLIEVANKSIIQMEANLIESQKNLENLKVKAPTEGTLSGFNLKVGESVHVGQRIGQIEGGEHIFVSQIDEHYLDKLNQNLVAITTINSQRIQLILNKISPSVINNTVRCEFSIPVKYSKHLKSGQSINAHLQITSSEPKLVIENRSFKEFSNMIDAFVIENGKLLHKRIKFGKSHNSYIEIVSELKEGQEFTLSDAVTINNYKDLEVIL